MVMRKRLLEEHGRRACACPSSRPHYITDRGSVRISYQQQLSADCRARVDKQEVEGKLMVFPLGLRCVLHTQFNALISRWPQFPASLPCTPACSGYEGKCSFSVIHLKGKKGGKGRTPHYRMSFHPVATCMAGPLGHSARDSIGPASLPCPTRVSVRTSSMALRRIRF
jgi:hypothetical protein